MDIFFYFFSFITDFQKIQSKFHVQQLISFPLTFISRRLFFSSVWLWANSWQLLMSCLVVVSKSPFNFSWFSSEFRSFSNVSSLPIWSVFLQIHTIFFKIKWIIIFKLNHYFRIKSIFFKNKITRELPAA